MLSGIDLIKTFFPPIETGSVPDFQRIVEGRMIEMDISEETLLLSAPATETDMRASLPDASTDKKQSVAGNAGKFIDTAVHTLTPLEFARQNVQQVLKESPTDHGA